MRSWNQGGAVVAQLSELIVPPAAQRTVAQQGAGVKIAESELLDGGQGTVRPGQGEHGLRQSAICRRTKEVVAELPLAARAKAACGLVGHHDARRVPTRGDAGDALKRRRVTIQCRVGLKRRVARHLPIAERAVEGEAPTLDATGGAEGAGVTRTERDLLGMQWRRAVFVQNGDRPSRW